MQGTDGIEDEQNSRNGQGLKRDETECVVDKTLISFALVTTDHKNEGGEEKTKKKQSGED